ncbi:MAG: hypothetical protein LVR00_09240 [Rhabdochlamydiaceae bacterium]
MKVTVSILSLLLLCGCFTRSQVISRGSFDDVQMGSPIADFEKQVGSPYRIQKRSDGSLSYEYIERIFMGEEVIEENHYYLLVKNGRIVAKRMNQEIPPAYDLIYEADPNNTDLQ